MIPRYLLAVLQIAVTFVAGRKDSIRAVEGRDPWYETKRTRFYEPHCSHWFVERVIYVGEWSYDTMCLTRGV